MSDGTEGSPNGWLREYLRGIHDDLGTLKEQVDDVQQRVARIEGSRSGTRRFWVAAKDWWLAIMAFIGVGWGIWKGSH